MSDSPSMDEIRSMTPDQAGAALAAMSAAAASPAPPPPPTAPPTPPPIVPANAQEERAQLEAISRDPGWSKAFWAGDRAARAQFDRLVQLKDGADVVGDALAGIEEPQPQIFETLTHGQIPARAVKAVIAGMRDAGLNDGSIEQALRGDPVSAAEIAATRSLQAARHGDAEWVKRLLSGDWSANREHQLMSIVLSSPIAEPK